MMIYLITFITALILAISNPGYSEETPQQRYEFNASRRLVFDTQTGKAYQFFKEAGDIKHIEIDYIDGTVKVNKTLSFKDAQYLQDNAIILFNQTELKN